MSVIFEVILAVGLWLLLSRYLLPRLGAAA